MELIQPTTIYLLWIIIMILLVLAWYYHVQAEYWKERYEDNK